MEDIKLTRKKKPVDADSIKDDKISFGSDMGDVKKDGPAAIDEDMNMLVSGMLHKDGKSFVRVSFLRGKDWAEGIVPDAVMEKSEGFSQEELEKLQEYLANEKDMIMKQAKEVNPIKNMFGEWRS